MKISALFALSTYAYVQAFFQVVLAIFFREQHVIGAENVPRQGAVIFTGNHQNQFVDGLMLFTMCPRDVRFLIAEKSTKRPIIGFFSRCLRAIPVKRRQDFEKPGSGLVVGSYFVCLGGGVVVALVEER